MNHSFRITATLRVLQRTVQFICQHVQYFVSNTPPDVSNFTAARYFFYTNAVKLTYYATSKVTIYGSRAAPTYQGLLKQKTSMHRVVRISVQLILTVQSFASNNVSSKEPRHSSSQARSVTDKLGNNKRDTRTTE